MLKIKKLNIKSPLRRIEYDLLKSIVLSGKVLDLGGSKNKKYLSLLPGDYEVVISNIEKDIADIVFDIEKKFPINNESFDNVLCFNVLEHVYNFNNVISNIYRILKQGGKLFVFTPFMFKIHRSPHDYFRYTDESLRKVLLDNGFKQVKIIPVGRGFLKILSQFFYGILPNTIWLIVNFVFNKIDIFLLKISKKYNNFCNRIPLGYFVIAEK